MKLKELYDRAVAVGMGKDPRGRDAVLLELEAKKKDYESLKANEKEFFDNESLSNPYADTRILHGAGEEDIKGAIVGIDMEVAEVLLADRLREKGMNIDLIISHHPEGRAYARLYEVMSMQSDILHKFGVPISIAEDLMEGRIKEVERRLMPVNHARPVDAARLLNIPFMCVHTPADNMVASYLQGTLDEKKPYRLSDVLDILKAIPEYKEASYNSAGPNILLGSKTRKAGKIFVDMTGGTGGSKDIFESMASSGINTIIAMHIGDEHRKEAEKHHLNVVIAGHIASDNLGMNLMLDELNKTFGVINIYECSGFRRVNRLNTSA